MMKAVWKLMNQDNEIRVSQPIPLEHVPFGKSLGKLPVYCFGQEGKVRADVLVPVPSWVTQKIDKQVTFELRPDDKGDTYRGMPGEDTGGEELYFYPEGVTEGLDFEVFRNRGVEKWTVGEDNLRYGQKVGFLAKEPVSLYGFADNEGVRVGFGEVGGGSLVLEIVKDSELKVGEAMARGFGEGSSGILQ